ncbi:hypothetical protein CBL_20249 [Carabus blaptoides fortunei]
MGDARGRPRALQCYVCERAFNARQFVRLIGDDNILKRHMAISKRDDLGRPGLALNDEKNLRVRANKPVGLDIAKLSDEEFKCIAPITKNQFEELHIYCDSVIHNGKRRYISKKNLLTFLCKMRQGLSDEFWKVIFDYSSRQNVSSVIDYIRLALTERFVPMNEPKTIAIIDSTYAYIHKSSNFRVLRQSFSLHKRRHLLKPTLIVAPDGFILSIFGPYFSNAANNDAQILEHAFQRDGDELRGWFQNNDIVLVDRSYRDAVPFLEHLGIDHRMPAIVQRGERQLSTEDANATRIITKTRWIVESRNGHLRSVFKFLDKPFSVQHANHNGDFYRIAGAILNRFYPVILIQNGTIELAQEMLLRLHRANEIQHRVTVDNLVRRNGQWRRLHHRDIPAFPVLDLDLGSLPNIHMNEEGFLRARIFSRFRNAERHQTFIAYNDDDINDTGNRNPITGYYCTCQSGARTVGTCAHIASIVWFLGYARHQQNIKYPDETLLDTTRDTQNDGDR